MVLDPRQKLNEGERVIELLDRQVDQLLTFSANSHTLQGNKVLAERQNALVSENTEFHPIGPTITDPI